MRRFSRMALLATPAIFMPIVVGAQTQTSPVPPVPDQPPQEGAAAVDQASTAPNDVVVTGSRLQSNGNRAPTPVTTVGAEQLLTSTPSNIPDALNKLPQFQLSTGPGRVSPGVTSLTNVGNYLNLRGIGINRSLILFDGRRVPATTDSGFVDTNTLPQLLVQRVDVVTAGASAAYGSDAVSGVVNFILDRQFNGLKGVAQSGITDRGDGANYRLGLAGGTAFADGRGHVVASVEHFGAKAIQRSARPLADRFYARGGAGTAASPYFTAANTAFQSYSAGGLVIGGGPLQGYQFVPGGLERVIPGTALGGGLCSGCNGGRFDTNSDLTPDVSTTQAYGRVSFEVASAFRPFVDVSYARSRYQSNAINTFVPSQTFYSGNPYLPTQAQALLDGAGAQSFRIGRLNLEFPFYRGDLVSTGFNATAGADGDLDGGWKYNGYYTHGEGRLSVAARNVLDNARYFAASDAVRDSASNAVVCRVTLTNPGLYPGCVPINLFGSGAPAASAVAYVLGTSRFETKNTLDVGAFSVSGAPFNLPAGEVQIAAGIEYRRQALLQTTNADPASPPAFTGIRGVAAGTLAYSNTNGGTADGSYTVKEAFAEIEVPLLRDSSLGHSFSLNGAVRVTDYSTSGTVVTWKGGGVYEPFDGLRVRVTRSRDIRAPNLVELFAGLRQSQNTFNDIHTGVSGSIFIQQSGNAALKPEKADTITAGIVVQPSFLRRFSASIDFYQVKINDAISTQTTLQINQLCEASNGTSPLCAFIRRPGPYSDRSAANYPISILQVPFNASSLTTRGIDFDIGQRLTLARNTLSLRLLANYLDRFETRLSTAAPLIDQTGTLGLPRWTLTGTADYSVGAITVSYLGRFFSGVVQDKQFVYAAADLHVPSYFTSDLTLSVDVGREKQKATFFLTANNLFDRQPPIVPQDQLPGFNYPTFQPSYDAIGRTFTAGLRFRF